VASKSNQQSQQNRSSHFKTMRSEVPVHHQFLLFYPRVVEEVKSIEMKSELTRCPRPLPAIDTQVLRMVLPAICYAKCQLLPYYCCLLLCYCLLQLLVAPNFAASIEDNHEPRRIE
jgi:hypothetical protein